MPDANQPDARNEHAAGRQSGRRQRNRPVPQQKENTANMSKKSNIATAAKRIGVTAITAGLTLSPFAPIASYADELNDANTPTTGDAFNGAELGANVGTGADATKLTLDDLIARAKQRVEEQQKAVDEAKANLATAEKNVADATAGTTKAQQGYDAAVASQNADEVAALQKLIDEKKQALADLEAKQAELETLKSQLDEVNGIAADRKTAYDKAQQGVADAKDALDKAEKAAADATPEKLNAAKDAYEQAKQAYDAAVAAKDKAEADLTAANGAVTDAQNAVTAANGKLADAQAAAQTAKGSLQAAQTAYDSAKAAYDAVAGEDPDKLAEKIDAAKTAMDSAKSELDAAIAADATAQANLQAAQAAVPAAQERVNAANAAVTTAQTAYDEANGKLSGATETYNAAKTAYEQAQQTEADKKAEYDRLVEVSQQKRSEWETACAASDTAKKAYDTANAEVEKLNQQIANLKSNMTVDQNVINQGMLGFMNYIIGGTQFTATQKKNAQDAVSMLTGADDKAEWYDQYVDQDMSRDTNPLSLEQMRNALTYLDTQNNLRKANGQSALSVSLRMTAAAALNTSYSSNIWGHSNCYFDTGENLAGGGGAYTGGETEDTLGWPYTGLYTQEKEAFDKYVAQYGDELGSHRYDSYYIYQNYNSIYHECGHYLNIIDSATEAIGVATGSGKNTDSEVTIFDYSADSTQADFTVPEFKKLLNDYIDSAYNAGGTQEQKEQLKQLQSKLADAQKTMGTADTAYLAALNNQKDAQDAYTAADTNANTAKGEYEKAKSGTAAAKTAYDAAKDALGGIDIESLKQNLDAAKAEATAAQTALDEANSKLSDCQTNASKASARKMKAQGDYDTAKAAYDTLAGADVAGAKAQLDAAAAALDTAKKADSDAQAAVSAATAGLSDAQSVLDQANAAKGSAQAAYDDAVAGVSDKGTAATEAETAYNALLAAANGVDAARNNLLAAEGTANSAKSDLDEANEALGALNVRIREASGAVDSAKDRSNAATETYNDVVADKGSYIAGDKTTGDAEVDALFKSVRDKQADVDQAKAGLEAAKAKHGEASDAYAAAKKIYDEAVAELNSRQTELDALLAHKRDDENKAPAGTANGTESDKKDDKKNDATKKNPVNSDGKLVQTGEEPNFAAAISVIGGALVASGVILKKKRQQ